MPILIKLCISNLLLVKHKLYFFVFPLDYCILDDEDFDEIINTSKIKTTCFHFSLVSKNLKYKNELMNYR